MIKALVFDFGRVISAPKPDALFHRYEADLGLAPGTINTIMFDSPHWQRALMGELNLSAYWRAIGSALNLHDANAVALFRERYYRDEKLNPGVLQLIRRLVGKYKLAILSNHPPGLRHWLAGWGIDRLFDVVVCSGDEGLAKPDPRVFALTLRRLEVSPRQAAFIDDTAGHVSAAQALGLRGILFTSVEALKNDLASLGCLQATGKRVTI